MGYEGFWIECKQHAWDGQRGNTWPLLCMVEANGGCGGRARGMRVLCRVRPTMGASEMGASMYEMD